MKKKICIVVSSLMTVKVFLLNHIAALSQKYNVSVVANTNDIDFFNGVRIKTTLIPIRIERKIALWHDLKALFQLFCLFRKRRFDIVHSITPKAGLLTMIAGALSNVPIRIHTFTGQLWATRVGIKRWLLKGVDYLLVSLTTDILVDSLSQQNFLIKEGVVTADKSRVLAKGSISGVDTARFHPDASTRKKIRKKENFLDSDIVFLYLGRLNKDKGLLDLTLVFSKLCGEYDYIHLMIVGPDEESIKPVMEHICASYADKIHFVDYTEVPEQYMAAADVFCLPSYREGFGSVIIEAACVGIPAIGSRIYGITDAIDEDVTGLLYEAGNAEKLAGKMKLFIDDPILRKKKGEAARIRAQRYFSKEKVTSAMLDYYEKKLTPVD